MLPSHCLPPLLLSWMPSWRCPSLLTPVWSPHLLKQTQMMPMTLPNWRTMRLPFFEDSARVSDAFAFVSDVFAAEADLAAALACTAASPAFVVAVEADDAALSADFPAAVALAEACPALVDAAAGR
ncbi:hypothetical protein [Escherichia coli]|uniref:hypothetical protein n=1 Tax=Escherichia coli TaxID=562 RepID=UPI0003EDC523